MLAVVPLRICHVTDERIITLQFLDSTIGIKYLLGGLQAIACHGLLCHTLYTEDTMPTTPDDSRGRRRRNNSGIEQVEIDTLMLADWTETINGKLYIQGGGWDRKILNPHQSADFAIAASVLVPWNLTNQQHEFAITIESEDGTPVAPALTGSFTVGRPPQAQPGQRFRSPLAVRMGLRLPGVGAYRVVMRLNNDVTRSAAFYVVDAL